MPGKVIEPAAPFDIDICEDDHAPQLALSLDVRYLKNMELPVTSCPVNVILLQVMVTEVVNGFGDTLNVVGPDTAIYNASYS